MGCAVLARMVRKGLSKGVTSEQTPESRRSSCISCLWLCNTPKLHNKRPNLAAYNNCLLFFVSLCLAWVVPLSISPGHICGYVQLEAQLGWKLQGLTLASSRQCWLLAEAPQLPVTGLLPSSQLPHMAWRSRGSILRGGKQSLQCLLRPVVKVSHRPAWIQGVGKGTLPFDGGSGKVFVAIICGKIFGKSIPGRGKSRCKGPEVACSPET